MYSQCTREYSSRVLLDVSSTLITSRVYVKERREFFFVQDSSKLGGAPHDPHVTPSANFSKSAQH